MALTGQINLSVDLKDVRTSDNESATATVSKAAQWAITAGTGSGQANLYFQDTRTLTTGAADVLDVAGALTNQFGTTVFTKVKAILVMAADANTTALTLSVSASGLPFLTGTTPALASLDGGDMFLLTKKAAGLTVGAGTADEITITNGAGASASYTIVIVGLS